MKTIAIGAALALVTSLAGAAMAAEDAEADGEALAGAAADEVVAPDAVEFADFGVPEPLTATPGDPEQGMQVFADRKLGNCLACHTNSELSDLPFHGEIGPPLDGVADRWEEAQLRGIVVNAKKVFPETIMPGFYSLELGDRVMDAFEGETILSAQQVEDVVAYLATLKQ